MARDVKIFAENLEDMALKQVQELSESPLMEGEKLRIMPDAHAGAGCVIGTTMTYRDKICPNIVGVDIGCGMLVTELGEGDLDFPKLDRYIKSHVPSGFNIHNEKTDRTGLVDSLRCRKSLKNLQRIYRSLGTLGGGNHFIEINEDDEGIRYMVIHTGSRNLGLQVAEHYQRIAKKKNPYGGLSFVTGKDLEDYLHDMRLTQEWAKYNRRLIREIVLRALPGHRAKEPWETVHNYVHHEDNIIRKGAIRAQKGEKVLIPLNMRDGSLICIGKGNPDWNYSAPHGAGRLMSRRQAKKTLNLEEFKRTMKDVYTTTANRGTLDEAPMAYKDSEEIKRLVTPAVRIEKQIRPLYNFKAVE